MTLTTGPDQQVPQDPTLLPAGRHGRGPVRRRRTALLLALVAVVVLTAALAAALVLRGSPEPAPGSAVPPASSVAASPGPSAGASSPAVPTPSAAAGTAVAADRLVLTATPTWEGTTLVVPAQVSSTVAVSAVTARVTGDGADRPTTAALGAAVNVPRRTAVLAVDTSGSMGPSGIAAARAAALTYAGAVGADVEIGLVAFSDTATLLTPPTTDRAALRAGLVRLRPSGDTALYDGLALAVRTAGRNGNVVVLSDGDNTAGRATLAQATAAVRDAGVRLDAVAFRTASADRSALESLSTAGRGTVLRATGAAGLGQAFAAAATAVPVDLTLRVDLTAGAGPDPLEAEVDLGGRTFSGQIPVPDRPGISPAAAPAPPARGDGWSGGIGGPVPLAAVTFVLLLGLVLLAGWPRRPRPGERLEHALAVYDHPGAAADSVPPSSQPLRGVGAGVLDVTDRAIGHGGRRAAIAERLDRAGLSLLPHEWVVLRACGVLASAAVFFLLVTPRWFGLLLGVALAWLGSALWLRHRQDARCRAFADQLPDTLQVVASSLRSGFALPQALAATQENAQEPMGSELGRALAAARIGVDLEDELERVAVRMRSEEWRLAVMAIRIQRSVGGSLAEVLSTTSHTLRERAALFRQARALSAEGRLSAYILLALPLAVGGFMLLFRREYLEPLWTTLPGLAMVAGGVVGMIVGTMWMVKVATVEV